MKKHLLFFALAAVSPFGAASAETILSDNFNSHALGPKTAAFWPYDVVATQPHRPISIVEDVANVFGQGTTNRVLELADLNGSGGISVIRNHYNVLLSSHPEHVQAYNAIVFNFDFHNPPGTGNATFHFRFGKGSLELANRWDVQFVSNVINVGLGESNPTYSKTGKNSLSLVVNNSPVPLEYELNGLTTTLASGSLAIWLNGSLVANDTPGVGRGDSFAIGDAITAFSWVMGPAAGHNDFFYVDNFSATAPVSTAFTGTELTNAKIATAVDVYFETVVGVRYQIQSSTDLINWTTVSGESGCGSRED